MKNFIKLKFIKMQLGGAITDKFERITVKFEQYLVLFVWQPNALSESETTDNTNAETN